MLTCKEHKTSVENETDGLKVVYSSIINYGLCTSLFIVLFGDYSEFNCRLFGTESLSQCSGSFTMCHSFHSHSINFHNFKARLYSKEQQVT